MLRDLDALSDAEVRTAYEQAVRWFAATVAAVPDDRWDARGADGRTARELVALGARSLGLLRAYLDAPAAPVNFVGRTGHARAVVARPTPVLPRQLAGCVDDTLADLGPEVRAAIGHLGAEVLARLAAAPADAVCATPLGAVTLADLLPSRTGELVVTTLEVARAVGADGGTANAPPLPVELALAFVHAFGNPVAAILVLSGRIGYDVVT